MLGVPPLWTCQKCGRRFANRNQTHTCAVPSRLDGHFVGKDPAVRETFDLIVETVEGFGPVSVVAEKTRIALQARMSFAAFTTRRHWLDGHVVLAERVLSIRFRKVEQYSEHNIVHVFRLEGPHEVDSEVIGWLRMGYEVGMQRHHRLTGGGRDSP